MAAETLTPPADGPRPAWPVLSIAEAHARLTAPGSRFEVEELTIRGVRTRVWKNAPATLREVLATARGYGERTCLVYEDERVGFEAFARAVLAMAERLQADGVVKGDRVAVVMRNLPEWPVAFFAAGVLGAVVTPLNAWWTGPELQFALADSGAEVAVVDAERLARISPHLAECRELERLYVARAGEEVLPPMAHRLEAVIGPPSGWSALPDRAMPEVELAPDDDATIFYTSGTTGRPKGALGTHRNMLSNILATATSHARRFLRRGEPIPPPDPNARRVTLLVVPLFHVTGAHANLVQNLYNGAKTVLMRKWDPLEALRLIERERVTTTGGVPTIAWQLVEHPDRDRYDLSSIEGIAYGGAPASPELVARIRAVFPRAAPGNAWGMTETSATFTGHAGEDYVHHPDSAGVPNPTGELKIIGGDGRRLGVGEVGEVWAKGPNVVKGYWNRPEATAETFVDGWVRTGDLGRVDAEGFLYIVDRAKDMLIRGGENIYCVEVENALYAHPAVMDAGVVGIAHRTLGEEPAAVVALKPGAEASEAELRGFVAGRIAAFKTPVRILVRSEALPRNVNGKILKPELKALLADAASPTAPG